MATRGSTCEQQLIRQVQETPAEYQSVLLQVVRLFRESVELKPAANSFRQGKEAQAGETRPASELWEGLDAP